jgi:NitT/TauT family transport system substrate-binding protein
MTCRFIDLTSPGSSPLVWKLAVRLAARVLGAAALGAAVLAAADLVEVQAQAAELQKIVITQPVASFSFLPLDYAKAAGLFQAEGFDVQQVATRGGGPDIAALISGDVQFNAGPATQQVGALRAHRDVLNVYNFYSRSLLDLVISKAAAKRIGVPATAPLAQRAAALKGLTLAMTRPNTVTHAELQHLARVGGLGPEDIHMVAIGDSPSMLAALAQGQIDGFTISIPGGRIAIQRGDAVMWVNNAAGDDPSVNPEIFQSLYTQGAYAKVHPDVVRGIIRALKKAVDIIATQPAEATRKVVQPIYAAVKPETMLLAIEAIKPALNRNGEITLNMAQNTMALEGSTDVTAEQMLAAYTGAYQ